MKCVKYKSIEKYIPLAYVSDFTVLAVEYVVSSIN